MVLDKAFSQRQTSYSLLSQPISTISDPENVESLYAWDLLVLYRAITNKKNMASESGKSLKLANRNQTASRTGGIPQGVIAVMITRTLRYIVGKPDRSFFFFFICLSAVFAGRQPHDWLARWFCPWRVTTHDSHLINLKGYRPTGKLGIIFLIESLPSHCHWRQTLTPLASIVICEQHCLDCNW